MSGVKVRHPPETGKVRRLGVIHKRMAALLLSIFLSSLQLQPNVSEHVQSAAQKKSVNQTGDLVQFLLPAGGLLSF